MIKRLSQHRGPAMSVALTVVLGVLSEGSAVQAESSPPLPEICQGHVLRADVVALDQVYFYNRFGAFNPAGMIYALRRDVVDLNGNPIGKGGEPGKVMLKKQKRPRPLVLRVHEGDCLQVHFTNLLTPQRDDVEQLDTAQPQHQPYTGYEAELDPKDTTLTRTASMHVNGLDYTEIRSDGAFVGNNPSSLVKPGDHIDYLWHAGKEGTYLLYSMGAPAGGEGDGGQLGLGLFGAVNVEVKGSRWYRSQVTKTELDAAIVGTTPYGTPKLNYDKPGADLNIVQGDEIIHSDLNALIVGYDSHKPVSQQLLSTLPSENCGKAPPSGTCGKSFREFTVIFHDELTATQAFTQERDPAQHPCPEEFEDTSTTMSPLDCQMFHGVRDAFGINYGASGMGSILLANRMKVGPSKACNECKYEEFFLTSWTNGDPAMIVEPGNDGTAKKALYPDDPANVNHSYLGEPVRFRNLHAGPKETHVFHLHAHQWLQTPRDEHSTYLDSQTVSPGAAFTYEIQYGGSGNRNLTPGDAIFHCHLYPHFAQGMWELWRVHDTFERGTELTSDGLPAPNARALRDGEISAGTPIPAIVPLPRRALPPMPSTKFQGYPFYIAAEPGHRPPQPPNDMEFDGGLPRHRIQAATTQDGQSAVPSWLEADVVHQRVHRDNPSGAVGNSVHDQFARKLLTADLKPLDQAGQPDEKNAMKYHAGQFPNALPMPTSLHYGWPTKGYPSCDSYGRCDPKLDQQSKTPVRFLVNGRTAQKGAPFADPCPDKIMGSPVPLRQYRAAYIEFDMPVTKEAWATNNAHGWHDRQARITVLEHDILPTLDRLKLPEPLFIRANSHDCIAYHATNLIPSNLNLDDFQIYTPTDTIGQHIHLVKFDVTSSDGAANGYNYEDGTFSPEEVIERILAANAHGGSALLTPKVHPLFQSGGTLANDSRGQCPTVLELVQHPELRHQHPWCGAQTTVQRWWADPLVDRAKQDRTIETVFTHDHFSPSSHQHHGMYGALIVEPKGAKWTDLVGNPMGGPIGPGIPLQNDGGPTSYAAAIQTVQPGHAFREFALAIGDFAIVYQNGTDNPLPVNPPSREAAPLPIAIQPVPCQNGHPDCPYFPAPEAISAADPGTSLTNYRTEPLAYRIADITASQAQQKPDPEGNVAEAFNSSVHGDPFTPLLWAYEGDHLKIRLIQGSQEEQHVFNVHGSKWKFEPHSTDSGWNNGQQLGISEHFEFDVAPLPRWNHKQVDYLYSSTASDNLWDGMWGILRVLQAKKPILLERTRLQKARLLANHFRVPSVLEREPNQREASLIRLPQSLPKSQFTPFRLETLIPKAQLEVLLRPSAETPRLAVRQPERNVEQLKQPWERFVSTLYSTADNEDRRQLLGQWGLARVHHVCPVASLPPRLVLVEAWQAKDLLPDQTLFYNKKFGIHDPNAILFVEASDVPLLYLGIKDPEPLIVRARAGECIVTILHNRLPADFSANDLEPSHASWNMLPMLINMPGVAAPFNFNQIRSSGHVALHPQLLSYDPFIDDGASIGFNMDSTVPPGSFRTYIWYAGDRGPSGPTNAPIEFGATGLRDMADVLKHSSHGAIGTLIVEPKGSHWSYPSLAKHTADVFSGRRRLFRDFAVLHQDDLSLQRGTQALCNLGGTDDAEDSGQKAINYRMEPFGARLGLPPETHPTGGDTSTPVCGMAMNLSTHDVDYSHVLSSTAPNPLTVGPDVGAGCRNPPDPYIPPGNPGDVGQPCQDPATPLFTAEAGHAVRFRIVDVAGHPRQHGFTVFGHHWPLRTSRTGFMSARLGLDALTFEVGSYSGLGPTRHLNILTRAGGPLAVKGDYLYRSQESFQFSGGAWGLFRVQ